MKKTLLFAIAAVALGLAGVPAFAAPATAPASEHPTALSAIHAAGIVLAQNEEKPKSDTDQGNEDSDSDND
jgi:hypothetical protein